MWECQNCHEQLEDTFEICWNCGTSRTGVKDFDFQTADQFDPASLPSQSARHTETDDARDDAEQRLEERAADHQPAYRFTTDQQDVIGSLTSCMNIVGIVSVIGGALAILAGCVLIERGGAVSLLQGALALVIGGLTVQAADSFRQIGGSGGDDIPPLMAALGALRTLYQIQVILLCIGLGLLALAFCVLGIQ